MYLKVELPWNVLIPPENLDAKGLMLQRAIIVRLMDDFAVRKATKDHGYFLALTSLNSIGEGKVRQDSGGVLFPVVFSCITFKPFKGEILKGVVSKVMKQGVFLTCGPVENIYIPALTMPDFQYVQGENPVFMNDSLSKIDSGVTLRFVVMGTKWIESKREFQVLGSLKLDFLGPV
ncbi:hypothetical protein AQUCO_06100013v1 [Aquilegia coerulea]|uniref:DNA-directed RNA polymerase subunit n=1 Tax=Aquilegia coerulea TaxID=218851 RepID=A0A2G5CD60_AQUCA|nr:hypothetical protein AQUCO_06100013v1 [Aquilegia coerulea]